MNASQILALSSVDARDWARHSDDVELLTDVRDAATVDTAKPRRTLLAAIEFRLAALAHAEELDEAEPTRDDAAPLTVEQIASINDVPVEVVVARLAETKLVAEAPTVDVATCAQAFVAALRSGDAVLVAAMIGDVRRQDIAAATMADALVAAFAATAPTHAPRTERAPRTKPEVGTVTASPMAERFLLALQHGDTAPDGTVTLDSEAMTRAGFPASWRTASLWHITYGSARQAARRSGLEGEFRGGILSLRPISAAVAA